MSFPEWGFSYNALYVPLCAGWQCALLPVRDMQEVDRGWSLSFEQRRQKKKERAEQIGKDRQDFDRIFRVSIDRRGARTSSDFGEYVEFICRHLRVSGWDLLDGEGITRVLRDAARDGRMIPVIDRKWLGGQRVFKHYAPQRWPNGSGQRASEAMNWRDFAAPERANGKNGFGSVVAAANLFSSDTSDGFDWRSAIETIVDADGNTASDDSMLKNFSATNNKDGVSLFSDASPFEYAPYEMGDAEELASSTASPDYAAKMLGYDRVTFGDMIHVMKDQNGLRGNDNVVWHDNGDVYFKGNYVDNMHNY